MFVRSIGDAVRHTAFFSAPVSVRHQSSKKPKILPENITITLSTRELFNP